MRISTGDPDSSTVLEVAGAHWAGGESPADDAAEIANDGRWPVIPRSITHAPLTWWEHERRRPDRRAADLR